MSARTAAATPGYCTLTATRRPSASLARYTCPIEAAAIGSSSNSANTSLIGSSSSSSITLRMSQKVTVGAASRSAASLRWNSSRYSSGTSPMSRNDITCPTFIAAPFIVPRAVDDLLGRLDVAPLEATWRPSLVRATFAAWVPACRIACPAASPPILAVRPTREVGILSFATAY